MSKRRPFQQYLWFLFSLVFRVLSKWLIDNVNAYLRTLSWSSAGRPGLDKKPPKSSVTESTCKVRTIFYLVSTILPPYLTCIYHLHRNNLSLCRSLYSRHSFFSLCSLLLHSYTTELKCLPSLLLSPGVSLSPASYLLSVARGPWATFHRGYGNCWRPVSWLQRRTRFYIGSYGLSWKKP